FLRGYVRRELNLEEPDMADHEARALRFVAHLDVPTPELLAADTSGDEAGVPAVLMSWLPGSVRWWPPDTERWLTGLAALLPVIHAGTLPPPGTIPPFAPYPQDSYQPGCAGPACGSGPWRSATSRPRGARTCSCTATSTRATSSGSAAP